MKSFTLLLLAFGLLAAPRAAETAQPNLATEVAESVRAARQMMPKPRPTLSIDFPGGTISDFLAAVGKIPDVSISIITAGDPKDLQTPLPAFSLRNTNAVTAMQVLARILLSRGFVLSLHISDDNSAVGVLDRDTPPKPRTPAPAKFESFQLAPYLTEQSIDDIVGAIRAAWELDPSHDPAALHLKFHPPTSILLLSGPHEGLDLAGKIISQLKVRKVSDAERRQAVGDEINRRRDERNQSPPPNSPAATDRK